MLAYGLPYKHTYTLRTTMNRKTYNRAHRVLYPPQLTLNRYSPLDFSIKVRLLNRLG